MLEPISNGVESSGLKESGDMLICSRIVDVNEKLRLPKGEWEEEEEEDNDDDD